MCLLCTRIYCKWLCESDLTCLLCKRIESDPYMLLLHHDLRAGQGLVVESLMRNLEICLWSRAQGCMPGVADEPIWNARMWYWNEHSGPGRELSATCEDHLWTHGGSKYFVREPPLEPSSRYLMELVGMLVPCLHKTWTTISQLTPYATIAVFTWHLVMNVL